MILPVWLLALLVLDFLIKEVLLQGGVTRWLVVDKAVNIPRLYGRQLPDLVANSAV